MLSSQHLYDLAKVRFDEAKILLESDKADGAIYLSGYAIELMLKRRIAHLLEWEGFPNSNPEFEGKKSFRIHNLNMLLHFSGLERKLQADTALYARWQIARAWDSEFRYAEIGKKTQEEARSIISATRDILNFILRETQ